LQETQELDLETIEDPKFYIRAVEFNRQIEFSKSLILELVTKSSQLHHLRFRPFMVRSQMLVYITNLKIQNSKLINLAIVRVYKQIIKNKEEVLVRYLNKIGMHECIISIYESNQGKQNMLQSLFLDIFSYLQKFPNKKVEKALYDKGKVSFKKYGSKEKIIMSFLAQAEEDSQKAVQVLALSA